MESEDPNRNYFIGDNYIRTRRDDMEIIDIFNNGKILDWDAYEKLLFNVYES